MTTESIKESANNETSRGPAIGVRHVQTLLLFLDILVAIIGRNNASVAIVAMMNAETTNPDFPEYDWNEKHKSYILSSFYWGYILTQFPGGYLSKRFGAKTVLFISSLGSGIFSLATPFCIPWGGWRAYCVIRILQGLFQGVMFPCVHEHLAKWSPIEERNRLGALSHAGIECGIVLAMFTTGMIAASSMGWPGIYYVSASLNFLWCGLWLVFGANNAPSSRFITKEEKYYIESSLKRDDDFHNKKIPIPWRAILTSVPFYMLLVVRCSQGWGSSTLMFEIPSYMNGVLNMNIKKNALYSALPYLTQWALCYVFIVIADVVLKKKWTSLTVLRKSVNSISMWIPAAGLIGIGFLDADQKSLAIGLMVINVGINSGSTIGHMLNTIDLSPNHAGILMGIVNMIANCILIITPFVAGTIVTDTADRTQWQIVFAIAAFIFFLGNLFYVIWGSAEVQPWDAEDYLLSKNIENGESPVPSDLKVLRKSVVNERNENGSITRKH